MSYVPSIATCIVCKLTMACTLKACQKFGHDEAQKKAIELGLRNPHICPPCLRNILDWPEAGLHGK